MQITPKTITDFSLPKRFVKGMASRGLAPLILLEVFVEAGRTYQAYKRGGFDEGRERITEEMIGAAFWFSGVKSFNKMIDYFVGKKLLKLPHTDFDGSGDALRKPLDNYLKSTGISAKKIANFKFAKVASSIILANGLVGFMVPKLNQSITNYYRRNKTQPQAPTANQDKFILAQEKPNLQTFLQKSDKKHKDEKNPAFNGLMNTGSLLSIANKFENDAKYQLLSTDIGIASGRAICARNDHERNEILIRDITSIYFYMFNMPNINSWMNQLEDGRKTRLDPVSAQLATDNMTKFLKENGGKMSAKEFEHAILGDNNNIYKITPELNGKFNGNSPNTIKLNDLLGEVKKAMNDTEFVEFTKTATKMADLQPEVDGIKYITKTQVKDVLRGGLANSPDFLDNLFEIATQEDIPFKKVAKSNRKNPFKFIAQSEFEGIKDDLVHYIKDIIKKADGKEITEQMLQKACKMNFAKNALNWGTGFVISAAFLSTFIPKIQYWVTKKVTGKDNFPGTADYSAEKKAQVKS